MGGNTVALWKIAYSLNNDTQLLELESPETPSMEQAVVALLAHARRHCEAQDISTDAQEQITPAVELAERYGITVTGISRAD